MTRPLRYHPALLAELERAAYICGDMLPSHRKALYRSMRGELIATDATAVLSEPVPVRVLGSVSHRDYWQEIQLRDTIARAWGRQDEPGVIEIRVGGHNGQM